jgi:transcriptional regulator with XRE-family HTH domain
MTDVALSKGVAVPRLRRLRVGRVLSQRDLAARAGVAVNTIAELEAGKRQAYPVTVRKLARALGVPPQELLESPADADGRADPRPGRGAGEEG